MDDGGSRQGRRAGAGGLRPMVVEATGWSEVGNNGDAGGSDKTMCGEDEKN